MPLIILSLLIQAALIIHVLKTGRNTLWIWVIAMLPGAGTLAYLVLELLPEFMGGRTARRASRKIDNMVRPNRDLNQAAQQLSMSDTIENTLRLAGECTEKGMYEEARKLYQGARKGIHSDDPDILLGLARCEFELGNFAQTRQLLDELIEKNPEYKDQEAHLLYAKAAKEAGDIALALDEFKVLADYYSGAEAKYCYAMLLREQGEYELAREQLLAIAKQAETSGSHYKSMNQHWISLARKGLNS